MVRGILEFVARYGSRNQGVMKKLGALGLLLLASILFTSCISTPESSYQPYPDYFGYYEFGNKRYVPEEVIR